MFNTKTLFILGAGASCPYGFPLGKVLIQDIINNMKDHIYIPCYTNNGPPFFNKHDLENDVLYEYNEIEKAYDFHKSKVKDLKQENLTKLIVEGRYQFDFFDWGGFPHSVTLFLTKISRIDIFNALQRALIDFDPVSIDAFLRDNPKYALAGKTMIVYSLLKNEDLSKFTTNSGNKDNWYTLLLNDLVSQCADKPKKLLQNKLRITTFNYDISLDYFLNSRLKNIEAFSRNESGSSLAEQYLKKLPIKHIYGQTDQSDNYNEFGKFFHDKNSTKPNEVLICHFKRFLHSLEKYNNIQTMYDERRNNKFKQEVTRNKANFKWANDIIIIGFGFDRDNLDLLGFPNTVEELCEFFGERTIRFLNYGGEMNSLSNEFKELLAESEKKFEIAHRGKNPKPEFKLIESKAVTKEFKDFTIGGISSAYLNDFKKYLFK